LTGYYWLNRGYCTNMATSSQSIQYFQCEVTGYSKTDVSHYRNK
jgi:hypothetical protein